MQKFRNATPEDRDQIELLTRLLVSEKKEPFDEKRFEWGIARRIFDPLQRQGTFVVEDKIEPEKNKELIAMVFSELRVDPFGNSEGYIKDIYIRPKYRTNDFLTSLLESVIENLKKLDIQVIKLNVKSDDGPSFNLYEDLNFQKKYSVFELRL